MNRIQDDAPVDRRAVEAALTKILSDPEFQKNANSARFLKFAVEEALDGRGDRLKGFTIATSALGRHSDFDPQSSSAVRVQAMRLRRLLEDYYCGRGLQDPVRIVLPIGSYQPRFERRDIVESVARPSDPPTTTQPSPAPPKASPLRIAGVAALGCLATAIAIAGVALLVRSSSPAKIAADGGLDPQPPIVVVEGANDVDATKDAKDVMERTVMTIESGLSVFDHLVVKRQEQSESSDRPDYALVVRAGPSGRAINDFMFELVHLPSDDVVWSRTFPGVNLGYAPSINDMSRAVVAAVAGLYSGAVIADQRKRAASSSAPPRGYFCLLQVYDYVLNRSLERRAVARECVEREFSTHPQDPRALTWITAVLFRDYMDLQPGNKGFEDMERVDTLAQRAFESDPHRLETALTLFVARFYGRHFDSAFEFARQLLTEFPHSRVLAATVGMAYLARDRYDEGMAILSPLDGPDTETPNLAVPALAFAAYLRGDEAQMERFARLPANARYPLGLVLRIIACARAKDGACVQETSQKLHRDYPGFAADVAAAFDRHAYADDIKARLLSDLRAAGHFGQAPI